MRKHLILGAVAAAALLTGLTGALATSKPLSKSHYICFVTASGATDCAKLNHHWHLRGVAKKFHKMVSFKLTKHRIRHLKHYCDTTGMLPGGTAMIYPPKHHHHH
ncbi:MAG: hypothetical protein AAFR04_07905 [Pseudomonadota bacterium]